MVKPGAISERKIEWQLIVEGEDVRETRRIQGAKSAVGLRTGGGREREQERKRWGGWVQNSQFHSTHVD